MHSNILYVGSYSELVAGDFGGHGDGISCLAFDAKNGKLKLLNDQFQVNPSYLSIGKIEGKNKTTNVLFAVSELLASKNPAIFCYTINDDYSLSLINKMPIEGGCPCHIEYFKNKDGESFIACSCYETGNLIVNIIEPENFENTNDLYNVFHKGSSKHPLRQTHPHTHCAFFDKREDKLLVADLGLDQVNVYHTSKNEEGFNIKEIQSISLPPGSGPRHICFDETHTYGFIINELSGSVTFIKHNFKNNVYEIKETVFAHDPVKESKKDSVILDPDLGGAAIRVSPNGKFVYASMRGNNTISLFAFDSVNESLKYIACFTSGGLTPRDFCIDATGNWLLVAHQDSDTITIYNVNSSNGTLTLNNILENIKSPVCLSWLPK